jgi:hypothetical protein
MPNKQLCLLLSLFLLFSYAGCGHEEITSPDSNASDAVPAVSGTTIDVQQAAQEIVESFAWKLDSAAEPAGIDKTGPPIVTNYQQETLVGDIIHYSMDVAVGPGPYDVVRLHRVFDSSRPVGQLRKGGNIFLLHGDGVGFVKFVFGSVTPALPAEQSGAVFLAQSGVDVWGMDQPWILVPGDLPDYSFAAEWGLQNQIENLDAGLAVARAVRLRTGFGPAKLNLLGYSSGGVTGYAYLNEQTQRAPWERHVSGFVAADIAYKYGPDFEASRIAGCGAGDFYQSLWEGGEYNLGFGFLVLVGELAETAPNDPSPLFPGLTNLQGALVLGSVPDGSNFGSPWYHYVAGVFDAGLPTDLQFTDVPVWLDFLQLFVPFEPTRFAIDYCSVWCEAEDVPWDDHLAEIEVPVLALGAAGGFGETAAYTLDLLGSTDKTFLNVSLVGDNLLDFAHIDLWTANNAPDEVWTPLLNWVQSHQDRPGRHTVRPYTATP